MSVSTSVKGLSSLVLAVVGLVACGGGSGTQSKPDVRPAAFRDADIYDLSSPDPDVSIQLPDCPASCDDQNPCTTDSCEPETHLCRNDPGQNGTSCIATDLCSVVAVCKSGLCVGTQSRDCSQPPDQCHEPGYCVPTTGRCTYPNSNDHKACDDSKLCTTGDQCIAGVCQAVPIQCGAEAECDPKTGRCPGFPTAIWGSTLGNDSSTAQNPSFSDLEVSSTGAIYLTLTFANTLDLGTGLMSTTSTPLSRPENYDYNAVVARLDPSTGKALWSRSMGDKSNQAGSSIAVNASETVLVSGAYSGKIDFGAIPGSDAGSLVFTNTGASPKVFLVALNGASNVILWAKSVDVSTTSSLLDTHTKVTVDPHDNNFVLCATPRKLVTDLGAPRAGGKMDLLVAKLSAETGQVLWVDQFGSAADESCDAVATDSNGKVYIAGRLTQGSSVDMGNGTTVPLGPTGKGQRAVYVAQLDGATGTALWAKPFYNQGTAVGQITASALVSDGTSVWLGGYLSDAAMFDDTPLVSGAILGDLDAGISDSDTAFLVSLEASSGKVRWGKNWGQNAQINTLASTSSGSILLGGSYATDMVFDSGALSNSSGSPVPFVAKVNSSTGHVDVPRGYASAATSSSWFQTIAADTSSTALQQDVSYAIGVLGASLDLGAPVGLLPAVDSLIDAGAVAQFPILLLVKFSP